MEFSSFHFFGVENSLLELRKYSIVRTVQLVPPLQINENFEKFHYLFVLNLSKIYDFNWQLKLRKVVWMSLAFQRFSNQGQI